MIRPIHPLLAAFTLAVSVSASAQSPKEEAAAQERIEKMTQDAGRLNFWIKKMKDARQQVTAGRLQVMQDDDPELFALYLAYMTVESSLPPPKGSYTGSPGGAPEPPPSHAPDFAFVHMMAGDLEQRPASRDIIWRIFEQNPTGSNRHLASWFRRHPRLPWTKWFLEQTHRWYVSHKEHLDPSDVRAVCGIISELGDESWLTFWNDLAPHDSFVNFRMRLVTRIQQARAMGTTLARDPLAATRYYEREHANAMAGRPAFPKLPAVDLDPVQMSAPRGPVVTSSESSPHDTRMIWVVLAAAVGVLALLAWKWWRG